MCSPRSQSSAASIPCPATRASIPARSGRTPTESGVDLREIVSGIEPHALQELGLAAALGVLGVCGGLVLSLVSDAPGGPAIVTVLAALSGALAVAAGAFGAHGASGQAAEWLKTGGIAALSYLVKGFLTNSVDEIGKPEPK